tara:strand:- start:1067 stop:1249 length:183 start_codon:yes stop_codon:yes gene_type:complete
MKMFNMLGYIWMILVGAVCGLFAFLTLLETGAPAMGIVLFGSGACFIGGWILVAGELKNA